jgi:hypothetical protein
MSLDATILIPIRQATALIEGGALEWLTGTEQPVVFVTDPADHPTLSALKRWLEENSFPATVLAQRRPRLSGALNDALEVITTRYVHWCGADDQAYWWRYPDVRARLAAKTPAWIVGRCDTRRVNGHLVAAGVYRNVLHPAIRWLLPLTNAVGCPAVIFSRDVVHRLGGFDESTAAAMDYDLWLRLLAVEPPVILPYALGRFLVHEQSLTRTHRQASIEDCYRARRRYFRQAWVAKAARGLQTAQVGLQDLLNE